VCGALLGFAVQPLAASASSAAGVAAAPTTDGAPSPDAGVNAVSCPSAGSCTAVGSYPDSAGDIHGLLLTESSGGWAPGIEATLPANGGASPDVFLYSVSCAAVGNCSAVGSYGKFSREAFENYSEGLIVTESSGRWSPGVEAIPPANAEVTEPVVALSSVSCGSADDCAAVGTYIDGLGHVQGLLVSETNGVWANGVEAPLPANAGPDPGVELGSVSCASAGTCTAVGAYSDGSGKTHGLLLSETNGVWATGVEAPLPPNASSSTHAYLSSVSCASASSCTAVGGYNDGSGKWHGLLLSETNGVWAPGVEAALPANAGLDPDLLLSSVSCAAAGNCSAVGYYTTSSTQRQGLLLSETSGVWAPGVEASLPANASSDPHANLGSVSCASAGGCAAVGLYTDSAGHEQGLLVNETEGMWAPGLEAIPPANAGQNPDVNLFSVSCTVAGSCSAIGRYGDCGNNAPALLLTETSGTWAPGVAAALPSNAAPPAEAGCPQQLALSELRVSPKRFRLRGRRVDDRCVEQTASNHTHRRCTRSIELTVSYTLSTPATVTFALHRLVPGRLVDGACVKPASRNRRHKRCTRLLDVPGKITINGGSGADTFTFRGRIGGKTLGLGSYQLTATPQANGHAGTLRAVAFRITA
jgi:hypothetical protein